MFSGSFTDARAQLAVGHSQRTAGAGHSATPAVDTGRSLPRVAPPSNSCRDSGPADLALGPPVTSSHGIPSPTLFSGHHQHTNNTPITSFKKHVHTRRVLPSRAGPGRSQCHGALAQLISECRPSMHLPPYPSYIPYSVYLFKPFFIRAEPSASRMTLQSSDSWTVSGQRTRPNPGVASQGKTGETMSCLGP